MMHTEEKRVLNSLLLRVGGTLTGAFLGALAAAALFVVAVVLDVLNGATIFQMLVAGMGTLGTGLGFAHPRRALHSLWFIFPDLFDK